MRFGWRDRVYRWRSRPVARAAATVMAAVVSGCTPAPYTLPAGIVAPAWEPAPPVVDSVVGVTSPANDANRQVGSMRLGPNDLVEITVFEASELNRTVRVDDSGRISLPLLGDVVASGRTPRELEMLLEDSLSQRYIRDPHVTVQVAEMQSHAVSVVGAVAKPGVFQIRGSRPLLELVAMAGGFAPDAGESAVVVRGGASADDSPSSAAAAQSVTVDLRALLESGEPRHNVPVHPGDLVKISHSGLVYVVGEVGRPGAFPLARRPNLTVLQAIALGEGFGANAARGRTVVIRTGPDGERNELPVDVGDVIAGRAADVVLQPQDVVFVPSSKVRAVTLGIVDALVRTVTLRGVF